MSAVPHPALSDDAAADALRDWLSRHRRVFVLTGAGCSTASGIPDYRDRNGDWKRTPPITLQALTGDASAYRRYWARSSVGWPRFLAARPNAAHRALAALEQRGDVHLLLTQNVDGLHQRAGSRRVIDLHGRLDDVACLGCAARFARGEVQRDIARANPDWRAEVEGMAPDGDADIDAGAVEGFQPPHCPRCGGLLKPDVVFFGENVPRERYLQAHAALLESDAMLVAGSSLMVWSGFRFARMAAGAGLPLAILNRGKTRADDLASLRLDADIGDTLAAALERIEAV
ncbi:NAD-dependent protein deacetylase [Luteimonas marina]|uniref:NAD-dependent protein deacetylase n=1 Tax=Luteimonas marina TaxID=488485 RepID=A0A5C5UB80_9GAMM|nr:NAD-dependent protein deacetylase [Luteimonas marina]TWT23188.1 NAD-dependent protein deacetylase [Luteimonas marina]